MASIQRITCPSCGSNKFRHDTQDNLICEFCGTKYASPREFILCATCGTENLPDAKRCMECGRRFEIICPTCDHVNPPGQDHCANCASPLDVIASVVRRANAQEILRRELVRTKHSDDKFLDEEIERRDKDQEARIATLQLERKKYVQKVRLLFLVGIGALIFIFLAVFVTVLSASR